MATGIGTRSKNKQCVTGTTDQIINEINDDFLEQQQEEIMKTQSIATNFNTQRGGGDSTESAVTNIIQDWKSEVNNVMGHMREMVQTTQELVREAHSRSENRSNYHHNARHHRQHSPSSSSDNEQTMSPTSSLTTQRNSYKGSKLPIYNGKESWKVWLNRFTDVAILHRWNDEQKLTEMLPRLQGVAGEFVYEQLPRRVRTNYGDLIQELNNRFKVIETSKTYAAVFS